MIVRDRVPVAGHGPVLLDRFPVIADELLLLIAVNLVAQVPLDLPGPLESACPGQPGDGDGVFGGPEPGPEVHAADGEVIERLDAFGDIGFRGAVAGEYADTAHGITCGWARRMAARRTSAAAW